MPLIAPYQDAKVSPLAIDRVILVGGSTRMPLVQQMIEAHLGQAPTDGIQPDLCVALGASLQAGVLVGEAVDVILVDVIPHWFGIFCRHGKPHGNDAGCVQRDHSSQQRHSHRSFFGLLHVFGSAGSSRN